jgi:hypothetical protein
MHLYKSAMDHYVAMLMLRVSQIKKRSYLYKSSRHRDSWLTYILSLHRLKFTILLFFAWVIL